MADFVRTIASSKHRLAIVAGGCVLLLAAAILIYTFQIGRVVEQQQERIDASGRVEIDESTLRAPSREGITLYLNFASTRATCLFEGTRYLATSGGLIALDASGGATRRYTTLEGLPENDITALAEFRGRLFIGTRGSGLVSFDGREFTRFRFAKPAAARVSVLVATASELLIGTFDGGLFQYDGERFNRLVNSAPGADFVRVTALLPLESRLYIGTQDQGLYIWREAQISRLSTADGLPSPHVTGLAAMPGAYLNHGSIIAATDFGVAAIDDSNNIKLISARPNVTSLGVTGNTVLAGLFSGGVVDLTPELSRPANSNALADRPSNTLADGLASRLPRSSATIALSEGRVWVLTDEGAYVRDISGSKPAFEPAARSLAGERMLSADHITGLALDDRGRLWTGYFDRGIDVIDPENAERLAHLEDEQLRQINYVTFDEAEGRVLAATSRGLVVLGSKLGPATAKMTVLTREKDNIISNAVAHVAFDDASNGTRSMVLATAGGLTQVAGARARSLTAFHGLASNHLYAAAFGGSKLYVGSLAGLVELEGLRVVRVYKTSNSRLSHDWVTALAYVDGTLYVGTNGGGVDALLPTGEWVNFADVAGKVEVNQNAMCSDGERLYVGTTRDGLLVYSLRDRTWTRFSAGLSSRNVTALTTDSQFVYAGTLNGLTRIEKRVIK